MKEAAIRWMGIKGYNASANRHIIIAMSRRYCRDERFEEEKNQLDEGEEDLPAGHGTHVAGMNAIIF